MSEAPNTMDQFRKEWDEYRKERNDRLHRLMVRILLIFAFGGITMSLTVAYVYYTSRENNDALCALRADSERRIQLGEEFLKEHPNGFAGISIDSLRRSTTNAKQTVASLSDLHCPPLLETEGSPSP